MWLEKALPIQPEKKFTSEKVQTVLFLHQHFNSFLAVSYVHCNIFSLIFQVINAARTLAARPRSKVAKENMDVFRDAWIHQVKVLTEAVDDITTIDDFLAVSGNCVYVLDLLFSRFFITIFSPMILY